MSRSILSHVNSEINAASAKLVEALRMQHYIMVHADGYEGTVEDLLKDSLKVDFADRCFDYETMTNIEPVAFVPSPIDPLDDDTPF